MGSGVKFRSRCIKYSLFYICNVLYTHALYVDFYNNDEPTGKVIAWDYPDTPLSMRGGGDR